MAHKIIDRKNNNKNNLETQELQIAKNKKLYRIASLTHNYLQKGKFRDFVNNVHKGNCIVQASSAENRPKNRNLVHKNIYTYIQK